MLKHEKTVIKTIQSHILFANKYETVDELWFFIEKPTGKKGLISVKVSSDDFIGYDFTIVRGVFGQLNKCFDILSINLNPTEYITNIICKQHYLVNNHIDSSLVIKTTESEFEFITSDLFNDYLYDKELFVLANNALLSVIIKLSKEMEEINKKYVND